MKVLVCGGAGYIGSHLVRELKRCGWSPVVVDSLAAHSSGIRFYASGPLYLAGEIPPGFLSLWQK